MLKLQLPEPDPIALRRSEKLAARIRAVIDNCGGWLAFDEYMRLVLYEPELGYYGSGTVAFGTDGDFTTAPELSPLFAMALAQFLDPFIVATGTPRLLELGAGSGRLAAQLIDELLARGHQDLTYHILETSAALRSRQVRTLDRHADRLCWIDRLPAAEDTCIVIANEVADALPVQRFEMRDGEARPLGVVCDGSRFTWALGEPDERLANAVAGIQRDLPAPLPEGFRSELNALLGPWIAALAPASAAVLIVDYGGARRDIYHAERKDGTLICHYRNRAHADPFLWPGLQDISAWVDFSAAAEAGRGAGLDVGGYTTQAQFLLESMAAMESSYRFELDIERIAAAKTLVLPGEMGETFKLLWLTSIPSQQRLPGRDFRAWL